MWGQQPDLIAKDARSGDDCQKARPSPVIAKLGEKGGGVTHQAKQQHPRQDRERDEVDRKQYLPDATAADEVIGNRNDAGRHDEGQAAAWKIADEPSDRGG